MIQWQTLDNGRIRLIEMTKEIEREIITDLGQINGIREYLQVHQQAGYQMYAKTKDERYLGYVDLATTLLNALKQPEPEEKEEETRGYDAMV